MPVLSYIFVAVAAYLLGSIPTGYLAARAKGIDIRTVGSGNIGATNAFRVLGKPIGTCVLLADGLKGYAACTWVVNVILKFFTVAPLDPEKLTPVAGLGFTPDQIKTLQVVAGICAVLGHNYTCWLKFKGGKGIATTAGVYFALAPLAVSIALGTWIILAFVTRYVSIASIAAAIALATAVWFTHQGDVLLGTVTTALSLLAIFKHKKNIQRLMAGTENRIGGKKNPTAEGAQ